MKQELERSVVAAAKDLFNVDVKVDLARPDEQFGDYATNVALQLAGKLGKNPREIAEVLANELGQTEFLSGASVAGPGFINLTLTDAALASSLESEPVHDQAKQTVVIETNNPNPFKALHIGHALNSITADTIANLLEAGGATTYRVSYHGDVGLHVGKSMYRLLKFVDGDPARLQTIPKDERNSFMSKMYAEGSKAYKEDENAKAEIDELAKQSFTREDKIYAKVYETCKTWSFEQIDATMKRLGNKPIVERFLESDADARGVPIVKENVPAVFQESDGALIFKGSEYGSFDNVFVNSRGLGLYGARDLGLMQLKNEQFHPDHSYIVTAEEQKDYFKGVIAAAELCMPELKGQTINLTNGLVKLTTGKMSSRSGEVVEIDWLFEQISEAIKARGGEPGDELVAGALRYEFLKVRIGSDVIFDINEAVSLQGNSGSYLQYAHARAKSVLQKAGEQKGGALADFEPGERSLARKISEYQEVVELATGELMPHHICTYLYELAQAFNRFYEKNRVIGDTRQDLRLMLVRNYASVLASGLSLLGIAAPDRM